MFRRIRIFFSVFILLLLILILAPESGGPVRSSDLPESLGQPLPGLAAPVTVIRDQEGMPHITARNDRDAFLAAGYVQAQDRLFQIDYRRRLFSGTLAEILGESALDSDIEYRTLGIRRAAEASLDTLPVETLALLESYAEGVNAWLKNPEFELPAEYLELELSGVAEWTVLDTVTIMKGTAFGLSFLPLELTVTDALAAFEEAGAAEGFDGRALFFEDLFRVEPFDPAVTVSTPPWTSSGLRDSGTGLLSEQQSRESFQVSRRLLQDYRRRLRNVPSLARLVDRQVQKGGSNFWVFSGRHTASGFPLLANDPHQALDAPSTFYEMQMQVDSDPGAGRMNVTGVAFAGTPLVVQGCNERICWGSTVNPIDVTDVYQETLSVDILSSTVRGTVYEGEVEPVISIPQTYLVNQPDSGTADDLQEAEVAATAGGTTLLVPRRNMGPIVAVDASGPPITALSVQHTGWSGTAEAEAFVRMARAHDVTSFEEALRYFDAGGQNWVYADVEGNIAYFTADELPLREDLEQGVVAGAEPWFVRDGTHEQPHEWIPDEDPEAGQALSYRILPATEMPRAINPESGYLANGNSDPVGTTLDNDPLNQFRPSGGIYYLSAGYTSIRMGRIAEMIEEKLDSTGGRLTLDDLKEMQGDNVLLDARVFLPHLLVAYERASADGAPTPLDQLAADPEISEAVARLDAWDYSTPTGLREGLDPGDPPSGPAAPDAMEVANSVAATLYSVWRGQIVMSTLDETLDRLGLLEHRPDDERSLTALKHLLESFGEAQGVGSSGIDFFVVDGLDSADDERDYLLLKALRAALDLLASETMEPAFGASSGQDGYRWGYLHRIRFDHPLGVPFSIPPAGGYQDLAPGLPGLARAGGYEVVDASAHPVRADGPNEFMFGSGPARRFVAELDPAGIRAYQIIPGGSQGAAESGGYATQLDRWLRNEYRPLHLSSEAVAQEMASQRLLVPERFRLFLPYFQGDRSSFTGVAVADIEARGSELEMTARGVDGDLLQFPGNPHILSLAAGKQSASLARELFGENFLDPTGGWIEVEARFGEEGPTNWPGLASFIQFGNFALTGLDGATAAEVTGRRLIFSRVHEGAGSFAGRDAETWLALANPFSDAATVELRLHGEQGPTGGPIEREIAAGGRLFERIGSLFGVDNFKDGYVEAVVREGKGLAGFELIRLSSPATVVGLNALYPPGTISSYSAQLAFSEQIFSSIALINTGDFTRTVLLSAVRGGGLPDLVSEPVELEAREGRVVQAADLFPLETTLLASLKVEVDGPGVVGDVIFGDPDRGRFAAGLPLQLQPFRQAVFGHVANVGDFFTGLALFNPTGDLVNVTVEVFKATGEKTGEGLFPIGPGDRLAQTLVELIPESAGQQGGYIRVTGSGPLFGQELFGTFDLRLQSAVPPTVTE